MSFQVTARYLPLLLLLLPAVAMAAVGCGSENSADAATVPMAKFAKQADLVCSAASIEQPELATIYLRRHPAAEEADLVEPAVIPPLEKMVRELKELALPREHEAEAELFLEEAEKALRAVKKDPEAALSEQGNPFIQANELSEGLKLGDCSRNP